MGEGGDLRGQFFASSQLPYEKSFNVKILLYVKLVISKRDKMGGD